MAEVPYEEATYLWVAERAIRKSRRPLRAAEIVDIGIDDGLFDDRELSKTPQKSMQARLSLEILNHGHESNFIRTSKGRFFLRDLASSDVTLDVSLLPGRVDGLEIYTAPRRIPPPPTESVLVISRTAHGQILNFQGIDADHQHIIRRLTSSVTYIPRTSAEVTEEYKQFVTYVVIQYQEKILSFRRGSYNRAAAFLRGARCIGFGGHVTESDRSLFSYQDSGIRENASRELSEELKFRDSSVQIDPEKFEILGVLNDDSTDVGRRHLAIVMRYWVDDWEKWSQIQKGETSINQLRWLSLKDSNLNLSEFEYWSQIVIKNFYKSSLSEVPSFRILRRSIFKAPHILAVVGEIGSGKSEATKILVREAGYSEINSGKVLAKILGIPPVPETPRAEFQLEAARFINSTNGPRRLGRALAQAVKDADSPRTIVDGIRHPATLQHLRDNSDLPVAVLYVHTAPDTAFELYRLREAKDPETFGFADFLEISGAIVERDVRYMIRDADVVMYNWLGVDAYRRSIEDLIEDLQIRR